MMSRACSAPRTSWPDSAARIHGFLCRGSDPEKGAKIVAERLRKSVEKRKFTFGGKDIPVTISLGIVADTGGRPCAIATAFLAAADKALYEAKRSGRNRVCIHGSEATPKR